MIRGPVHAAHRRHAPWKGSPRDLDSLRATDLYPPISPHISGLLPVGDGHTLYWEQCGTPWGIPVIYLHGGPGSGCLPTHRRFYDPDHYRIVLFDQRGCGRSTPLGETRANTTAHLIADIEALRQHLGISRWLISGGSWGTTLALAYGQAHPESCLGFILRGVFLFSAEEVNWFLHGMGRFFPEAERHWLDHLSETERSTPLPAYARRLNDPDPMVHGPAAHIWNAYEHACSSLRGTKKPEIDWCVPADMVGKDVVALARLEIHYMQQLGFLAPNQLLNGLSAIRDLPAAVVQGRYDMVCPIKTAESVVRAWPGSAFTVVPDAGHSAFEPGIRSAMVRYTDAFAQNSGMKGKTAFAL
ncbi:MAG: prolyl aminopeptidase [Rhodospirillaceae bacterium]|nr:prolyl aminopeptidase [Rhodospirillaceae bacterium]